MLHTCLEANKTALTVASVWRSTTEKKKHITWTKMCLQLSQNIVFGFKQKIFNVKLEITENNT
jgi:hypothetical protein